MIIAHHIILSAYGFWLPNDPRGSWSDFVGSWELFKFGPATKVTEGRSYAHDPHDVAKRRAAKKSLKYPPVRFNEAQRLAIGAGFGRACDEANYICHACCIGHDHAHLVIQRHDRDLPALVGHLKSHATRELTRMGIHPLSNQIGKRGGFPTPWSEGFWNVFIEDPPKLRAAIAYVQRHPAKEGLLPQNWSFINSPLARSLATGSS